LKFVQIDFNLSFKLNQDNHFENDLSLQTLPKFHLNASFILSFEQKLAIKFFFTFLFRYSQDRIKMNKLIFLVPHLKGFSYYKIFEVRVCRGRKYMYAVKVFFAIFQAKNLI